MNACTICGAASRRGLRVRYRWQIRQFRCRRHWRPAMVNGAEPAPTFWERVRGLVIHLFGGITPKEYGQGIAPRIVIT